MVILTNARPPALRSVIAVSKTMSYEWHSVGPDGSSIETKGILPKDIYKAFLAEWAIASGRSNAVSGQEEIVYVGDSDGVHPAQVQRLLDYLSK